MPYDELHILGNLHVVHGEVDSNIRKLLALAAAKTKYGEGSDPHHTGLLQNAHDIARVATATKHDQQITLLRLHCKLLRKNMVVPYIVGQTSHDR